MRKVIALFAAAAMAIVSAACGEEQHTRPEPEKPEEQAKITFAQGADISWVTEMERDGVKFYDASGSETECTALMKQIGFDAIRLRVWVDPEEGWCGKEDVIAKAKRAHDLGMRLMIDFHYSDYWADPGKQNPPAAWKGYSLDQLTAAVDTHTKDILNTLKDNGINIEWIQIGNEVNNGMLWPEGKVQGQSAGNFISLFNTGSRAVRNIYPSAKVILHVSNGHDAGLFGWFFNLMKLGNADYDIIGMSLYPMWWENGGWNDWKGVVDKCLANIRSMNETFGKPVMLYGYSFTHFAGLENVSAGDLIKITTNYGIYKYEVKETKTFTSSDEIPYDLSEERETLILCTDSPFGEYKKSQGETFCVIAEQVSGPEIVY